MNNFEKTIQELNKGKLNGFIIVQKDLEAAQKVVLEALKMLSDNINNLADASLALNQHLKTFKQIYKAPFKTKNYKNNVEMMNSLIVVARTEAHHKGGVNKILEKSSEYKHLLNWDAIAFELWSKYPCSAYPTIELYYLAFAKKAVIAMKNKYSISSINYYAAQLKEIFINTHMIENDIYRTETDALFESYCKDFKLNSLAKKLLKDPIMYIHFSNFIATAYENNIGWAEWYYHLRTEALNKFMRLDMRYAYTNQKLLEFSLLKSNEDVLTRLSSNIAAKLQKRKNRGS